MDKQTDEIELTFPAQLDVVKNSVLKQAPLLRQIARIYADAIGSGGMVHVYANGHSRVSVEELVIRMGALTGFHPILSAALTTFTDVVGSNGLRVDQFFEKVEGSGSQLLEEVDFGPKDALIVITATGTTIAAVDIALEFTRRYPTLPLIAIASAAQSKEAPVKHSCGMNLWHIVEQATNGYFIDNGMPVGDLTTEILGKTGTYRVCPLSSIGALTIIQSLNELTIRELDSRGIAHHVLRNMHLQNTQDNYDQWLSDQRKRYALSLDNPNKVMPVKQYINN
jgi:uncharacterized phosphosugar-binding protein